MTKSYVSLETKVCPVCGIEFETESILMDTKMRDSMETRTTTGYGLCKKHQAEFEDGFIHLVVADSEDKTSTLIKIEDALYTGEIISVKRDILCKILDKDIDARLPFVYIDQEAANIIKEMAGITDPTPEATADQ